MYCSDMFKLSTNMYCFFIKKKTCTVKFLYKKKHVMHRNTIYKTQLISAKPVNILGTA